jgi:hypothetical protein
VPCQGLGVDNGQCAYGAAGVRQFGSAANNTERAPGYEQIDLAASKSFAITEAQHLEFRTDFFNAFNIASYDNPDSSIQDKTFGKITNVRSLPGTKFRADLVTSLGVRTTGALRPICPVAAASLWPGDLPHSPSPKPLGQTTDFGPVSSALGERMRGLLNSADSTGVPFEIVSVSGVVLTKAPKFLKEFP